MWRFRFTLISIAFRTFFAVALAIGIGVMMVPNLARAEAEKRVALVIGNGDYKSAPHLDNPPIDARAVADEFKKLGFQVVEGYDLDVSQMRKAVSEFSMALPDAKAAVVYYAGHAVSVDDENYLLPVDIVLKSPTDLDIGAISMSLVLKEMKREERVNIVFLDASRDNPFAAVFPRHDRCGCARNSGLSPIQGDLARGTLVAFPTDPNSTALDGAPGQHSPFTEALLNHLADPGASIDTVMTRVRSEVWEKTEHRQRPWVNTSLTGEFSFNPRAPLEAAPAAAPAAPPTSESEEMYQHYLDSQPEQPDAQPENPQATPSVQTPATGYHQYYHYQPYHYLPDHSPRHSRHYNVWRVYVGPDGPRDPSIFKGAIDIH